MVLVVLLVRLVLVATIPHKEWRGTVRCGHPHFGNETPVTAVLARNTCRDHHSERANADGRHKRLKALLMRPANRQPRPPNRETIHEATTTCGPKGFIYEYHTDRTY